MRQDENYCHRASFHKDNQYRSHGQQLEQGQPRSFSLAHLTPENTQPTAGSFDGQWRNWQNTTGNNVDVQWQHQQLVEQTYTTNQSQQPGNNLNILTAVRDVLRHRGPNDAPWNPQAYQHNHLPTFDAQQFSLATAGPSTAIPDTRSQNGSFANDSGYHTQSFSKSTLLGEDSGQTGFDHFASITEISSGQFQGQPSAGSVVSDSQLYTRPKRPNRARRLLSCAQCGKRDLKNKSDLQKHLNQHEKPYRCRERGCDREEGFGTRNDVERHRASVHKLTPNTGTKAGFICAACELVNPGAYKWWLRKDNFKAHIKRKHSHVDEEQLIEQSRRGSRPLDALTDLHSAPSHHVHDEDRLHEDFSPSQAESFQPNFQFASSQSAEDIVAGGGQWANMETSVQCDLSGRTQDHEPTGPAMSNFNISPTNSMMSPCGVDGPSMLMSESYAQPVSVQAFPATSFDPFVYNSKPRTSPIFNGRQSEPGYTCQTCGKPKKRACDLRKHEKRHTRPYGCTFPRCWKRFGSRNDWKRHESGQHFSNDQWRCQLPNHDGSDCAKLFERREDMSAHLDSRHGNEGYFHDSMVHFDAIDGAHFGGRHSQRFWCGFCNAIASSQSGDADARVQHVGDHFDKGHLTISDWVDVEENKTKRSIRPPTRQRSQDTSVEDSDLGDDGIPEPPRFVSANILPLGRYVDAGAGASVRRGGVDRCLDFEDDAAGESDYDFARRMMG